MIRTGIGFILVLLTGCSTASTHSFVYTDLAYKPKEDTTHPESVSPQELKEDLDVLVYALTSAYAGKQFLPEGEYEKLISSLKGIEEIKSTSDFCKRVGEFFSKVSDRHLSAWLADQKCGDENGLWKAPSRNSFKPKDSKKFWDVSLVKKQGRTFLTISVLKFVDHSDPRWSGFMDSLKKNVKRSDAIILDLRGNSGGDDSMGLVLAEYLSGQEVPWPYSPIWNSATPEALQLELNWVERGRVSYLPGKVPLYIQSRYDELLKKIEDSKSGKLSHYEEKERPDRTFDPTKGYPRPIYILMDQQCLSSCESTIDYFEHHPRVKRVGQNTGGYLHFGNVGDLFLPHSHFEVHLGTSYFAYKDGRFLEKKGIEPVIPVPESADAFDFAVQDFLKIRQ